MFKDGRKRLIDLVILPYLINIKGLNVNDAVQMCFEWVLKNHQIAPIKIGNKIFQNPICLGIFNTKPNMSSREV
ncbi:MAG: hypothetical protein QXJ06_05140 [Candidatus Aenigmatarchaeota archaeon]